MRGTLGVWRRLFVCLPAACWLLWASSANALVITFDFTGALQSFIVPAGVNRIQVDAWGAQGWHEPGVTPLGGLGGYVEGEIPVLPGEELLILVGGTGTEAIGISGGGFNGGGDGANIVAGATLAGGGGGATEIRRATTRLLVAGGGGGATANATGGHGGGATGGTGGFAGLPAGTGGTLSSGGMTGGGFGFGGDANTNLAAYAAGGGGGYYGGGASLGLSGGGGGSSFSAPFVSNASTMAGVRSGDGFLTIEFDLPFTAVPEPTTLWLMLSALLAFAGRRWIVAFRP